MDWSMLALAGAGLFLAGIVKGATGLGYASCALPFLVSAIGLKPAMALVIIPAMATNVSVAFTAGHFTEVARRFSRLYVAMLPGIAVGIYLLVWIAQSIAVRTLGVIIIGYALMTLCRPHLLLSKTYEHALQVPTGFANGVLTGLTGSQVMPLFPYMMALDLDPNRMVQAINLAVMLASVCLAAGLFSAGVLTPELAVASLLAVLPALVGVEFGNRMRAHIPAAQFRSVVLYVLLGTGALLLLRS
jgi:uncharacterized membrane protein YfcA